MTTRWHQQQTSVTIERSVKYGITLALLLSLCDPALADRPAEDLLERVGAVYSGAKSYHFLAREQTVTKGDGAEKMTRLVAMTALDGEGRTRVEFDDRVNGGAAVDDGVNRWVYVPSLKKYAKLPSKGTANPAVPGLNFEAIAKRFTGRYAIVGERIIQAKISGNEPQSVNDETVDCVIVDVEYGPPPGLRDGEIKRRFWIDRRSLLIVREHSVASMETPQAEGRVEVTQDIFFDIAHAGKPVSRELFYFVPPSDALMVESFSGTNDTLGGDAAEPAPDFTLTDFDGESVQLSSLRGKVVLLDFWATWCGPCRYDMPFVQQLYEELKPRGLEVYGVNAEGNNKAVSYLNQFGYTFPNLIDRSMTAARLYNISAIPTFIVIDRQGKLSSYMKGTRSVDQLRAAIMKAGL